MVCTGASSKKKFLLSFDGTEFLQWEKGLGTRKPFSMLVLKAASGETAAQDVDLYYGSADLIDYRLIPIEAEKRPTVGTRPADTFFWKDIGAESWNNLTERTYPASRNAPVYETEGQIIPVQTPFVRAYLLVTVRTATGTGLSVYARDWNSSAQTFTLIGRVLPGQQNVKLEANSEIKLKNESGAVLNALVAEVFYADPDWNFVEKGPELAPNV